MHLISYEQNTLINLKKDSVSPVTHPKTFRDARLCVQVYRYIRHYTDLDNFNLNYCPRPKFKPKVV